MGIFLGIVFNIMKNKPGKIILSFMTAVLMLLAACEADQANTREHYFLKGYDDIEFRDTNGVMVPPSQFITTSQMNGRRIYRIVDTSLTLVTKRTGTPYEGYIRTFHRDRHNLNLQGEFEGGKMYRLRYWHPNRTLGMDADYRSKSLSIWTSNGKLVVEANADETYYFYPGRNAIKEIINDTMRSYFDTEGDLERYVIYRDTATIHYNANGQKVSIFPFKKNVGMHGMVKQWYPNGQLKLEGRYENGSQVGTWIEYDSLGNLVERKEY